MIIIVLYMKKLTIMRMMNNKQLYNQIIHNVSKAVKQTLNEEIQNFNPVDYQEDDTDIISQQDIDAITNDPVSKLIRKVLTGRYNSVKFTDKEVKLWNSKIDGKIIDSNATLASFIDYNLPDPYFIARLVNIENIDRIAEMWATLNNQLDTLIVTIGYININKNTISDILKYKKNIGIIGIFEHTNDNYTVGVTIDTNNQIVKVQSKRLAKKLGYTTNDINNGNIIIDKTLDDLILSEYFDFNPQTELMGIDFIYLHDYKYKNKLI